MEEKIKRRHAGIPGRSKRAPQGKPMKRKIGAKDHAKRPK